jgi:mannose-6-phosphate isomerase-like protein (cupin superfamily)
VQTPLLDHDLGSAGNDFQVSECEEPAASGAGVRKIAPLHRHRSEDEAWYVLRGRLRFQFGSEEFDASEGSGVLLPNGVAHTFWNPASAPARYLIIVRPKTAALLQALHQPGRTPSLPLRELFSKFDVDLLE